MARGKPATVATRDLRTAGPLRDRARCGVVREEMTDVAGVHILPHELDATWTVEIDAASAALSSHQTADQAQLAATRVAEAQGADRLYLHDRYQRVRTITLSNIRR
jgi:hypothetical protein